MRLHCSRSEAALAHAALVLFAACGHSGSNVLESDASTEADATQAENEQPVDEAGEPRSELDASELDSQVEPRITLVEYCAAMAAADHDFKAACHGKTYDSEDARNASIAAQVTSCMGVESAVTSARIAFDPAKARECLTSVQARSDCGDLSFLTSSSCGEVLSPLVALEQRCKEKVPSDPEIFVVDGVPECADGWCDTFDPSGVYLCRPRARSGPCTFSASCAVGYGCSYGQCVPVVGYGAPCFVAPCGAGLVCDTRSLVSVLEYRCILGAPACGPLPCSEGRSCSGGLCRGVGVPGEVCTGASCAEGNYCADTDGAGPSFGVCVQRHENDVPCTSNGQCASGFCTAENGVPGVCHRLGAEGDECGGLTNVKDACHLYLRCMTDGKCHRFSQVGDPCGIPPPPEISCDYRLWCSPETDTCQAPIAAGLPCVLGVSTCEQGSICRCNGPDACSGDTGSPGTCEPSS